MIVKDSRPSRQIFDVDLAAFQEFGVACRLFYNSGLLNSTAWSSAVSNLTFWVWNFPCTCMYKVVLDI
ncbi:hypothetical protein C1H46_004216 [Malus baccata]|uniref:Uncharacterized protein n=1 Tax=Malus baccata TaxID=106549 RepID=A0A540NI21_MALBA|nr:hypothetical protein C1H46_004216 [Malus baccata]